MMYPYNDPTALIAIYNDELRHNGRIDVRWSLDPTGRPYLHDCPMWTASRTRELKAKDEREQRNWIRAQERAANAA